MSDSRKDMKETVTIESVLGKGRLKAALSQPRARGHVMGPEALLEFAVATGNGRHPGNPEAAACAAAIQLLQWCGSKPDLALLKRYAGASQSPRLAEEVARKEGQQAAREARANTRAE